jgi:hypothetical protein
MENDKAKITRSPIEVERRERDRWKTEMVWLDTKFFIPVDFAVIDGHEENDLEKIRNNFVGIPTERKIQYEAVAHNYEIVENLKKYESKHGVSVFKYVAYEQMEHIYGCGIMTKAQLEAITPTYIGSNEKHLTPMQFAALADIYKRYRKTIVKKENGDGK